MAARILMIGSTVICGGIIRPTAKAAIKAARARVRLRETQKLNAEPSGISSATEQATTMSELRRPISSTWPGWVSAVDRFPSVGWTGSDPGLPAMAELVLKALTTVRQIGLTKARITRVASASRAGRRTARGTRPAGRCEEGVPETARLGIV